MGVHVNLVGSVFGRLKVLSLAGTTENKMARLWNCECSCGGFKVVSTKLLNNGTTKSCGCLRVETLLKRNTKHGDSKSQLYGIWCSMLSRCYNQNNKAYPRYGGRGIKVCDDWHEFSKFKNDMGCKPEGLSLERKDNDVEYSQVNCMWATCTQQNSNRRDNVHVLLADGSKVTLAAGARLLNIKRQTFAYRVKKGTQVGVTLC